MPTFYYCKRCGETESNFNGNEEFFQYGCKFCYDLPFGSFIKEVLN